MSAWGAQSTACGSTSHPTDHEPAIGDTFDRLRLPPYSQPAEGLVCARTRITLVLSFDGQQKAWNIHVAGLPRSRHDPKQRFTNFGVRVGGDRFTYKGHGCDVTCEDQARTRRLDDGCVSCTQ